MRIHSHNLLCTPAARGRTGRAGFTLLESLLASVILAASVSAVLIPYSAGARNDAYSAEKALATSLASDLMEEIIAHPFSDPDDGSQVAGPDSGEYGQASFDNVDDFHGLTEPAGFCTTDPRAAALSRGTEVQYVFVNGQDASEPPKVCRVTITVDHGDETLATLTRLVYCNE
jgi:prepilin-type N-terminal cleavage/methylation domain-containing protein